MSEKEQAKNPNSSGSRPLKKIAIIGLPNTGKSQLFKNLTGQYTPVANYLIECESSNIAIDEEIVSNIWVWREPDRLHATGT